jgi:glycosyltransferase involved in cell wall biosynthesis
MPRFSLIVPTLGRTIEIAELFASIDDQNRSDVELIIVDQNDDDRLVPLIKTLPPGMAVRHIRLKEKNPSSARNAGLEVASGEIIAFPDDDCWYPPHLLDRVDRWFQGNGRYGVLAVGALDGNGECSGNRWPQNACDISPLNALRTTFCSSLFISSGQLGRAVRFDPNLFPGEETDVVLRLLATGVRGRFDRGLYIHHPRRDMLSGTVSRNRATKYGAAMGILVRRHSLVLLWIGLMTYDVARALLVSARGRFVDAGYCLAHSKGLFLGFVLPKSNYE